MSDSFDVTYKCRQCGAEDHDRGEGPKPQLLNCWNCHAGQGLDIAGMYEKRQGMWPVEPEPEEVN